MISNQYLQELNFSSHGDRPVIHPIDGGTPKNAAQRTIHFPTRIVGQHTIRCPILFHLR
jgi:hypothetical protein